MNAYFDTSALVPLLVDEPTSLRATRLWRDADRVASVRLLYPEARAALARAQRMGRLSSQDQRVAVAELGLLERQIDTSR